MHENRGTVPGTAQGRLLRTVDDKYQFGIHKLLTVQVGMDTIKLEYYDL
jgi:hypothetical protein